MGPPSQQLDAFVVLIVPHLHAAKSLRLAGIIPVQPYFGGEERTESELRLEGVAPVVNLERSDFSWKAFLPVGATRDHPAAHVTDENAELAEDFPPTLLEMKAFVESNRVAPVKSTARY
uniref:Uncharacterized protein n=1 Tax=Aegilops tauschii TaxID=37682 RepID=N1QQE9_AEGTA